MFCTKCGSELPEGVKHCFVCGAAVRQLPPLHGQGLPADRPGQNAPASPGPAYQAGQPLPRPTWPPRPENDAAPPPPGAGYTSGPAQRIPGAGNTSGPAYHYPTYHHDADPVGVWEWLWSSLVLLVPMLNIVLLAVWAFGLGAKPSKRSWARAVLILYLVLFLLFVGWNVYLAMTGQLDLAP